MSTATTEAEVKKDGEINIDEISFERPEPKQKDLVDEAESMSNIDTGNKFVSYDQANEFLKTVVELPWWKKNVPLITSIKVESGKQNWYIISRENLDVTIQCPEQYLREMQLVLSALRLSTHKDTPLCSEEYCKLALRAVRKVLGYELYKELKDSYKRFGVRYIFRRREIFNEQN